MYNASLEITDKQYFIKLNKEDYKLSLIRQLLQRIETENSSTNRADEIFEEDIISRNSPIFLENFDRLEDK